MVPETAVADCVGTNVAVGVSGAGCVGTGVAVNVAARVDTVVNVGVTGGVVEMVAVWLIGSTTTYPLVKSRRQVVPT